LTTSILPLADCNSADLRLLLFSAALLLSDDFSGGDKSKSSASAKWPQIFTGPLGDFVVCRGHIAKANVWLTVAMISSTTTAAQLESNSTLILAQIIEVFRAKAEHLGGKKLESVNFLQAILTNFNFWSFFSLNIATGHFAIKTIEVGVSVVNTKLNWSGADGSAAFERLADVFKHLCGWLQRQKEMVTAEMIYRPPSPPPGTLPLPLSAVP